MGLRLKRQLLALTCLLAGCSVYNKDLLVETTSSTGDSTLTSDSNDASSSTASSTGTSGVTNQTGGGNTMTAAVSGSGSAEGGSGGSGGATTTDTASMTSGGGTEGNTGGNGGSVETTTTTGSSSGIGGAAGSTGAATTGSVMPDPLLIDNLEDGDGQLDPNFTGYWYMATDEDDGSGSLTAPETPDAPRGEAITPAREDSTIAMHAAGSWDGWGAALGFSFSTPVTTPVDISAHSGISFWARAASAREVRMEVVTETTTDSGAHFGATQAITTTWQQYEILWDDLAPPPWSLDDPPEWHPEAALKIQFHFDAVAFDFWVDDIRFIE